MNSEDVRSRANTEDFQLLFYVKYCVCFLNSAFMPGHGKRPRHFLEAACCQLLIKSCEQNVTFGMPYFFFLSFFLPKVTLKHSIVSDW